MMLHAESKVATASAGSIGAERSRAGAGVVAHAESTNTAASAKTRLARPAILFLIFIGALDPHERLQIYHVAWPQVAVVAADPVGECEQAGVRVPVGPRDVLELEAVFLRGHPRDVRLEKDVPLRLSDESEHGEQRPGEHP